MPTKCTGKIKSEKMKRKVLIAAAAVLLLFLVINAFDFYYTAHLPLKTYPKPVTIEFTGENGRPWHRYYAVKRFCLPVRPEKLSDELTARVKRFFRKKTGGPKNGQRTGMNGPGNTFLLSFPLAPHLFGKSRVSLYFLQRLREYRNMLLMSLLYSEEELISGLLNWKRSIHNAYGAGIISEAVYGKSYTMLTSCAADLVLEFLYGKSSGNEHPFHREEFIEKTGKYLREKNRNLPPYGGSFRDYCLSLLNKEGILRKQENIRVSTTMNSEIQKRLEEYGVDYIEEMKDQDENRKRILSRLPPVEAATVVVRTGTGAIAGLTGSIRYSRVNSFNRAVNSRRQISSTFKPFLYALAVEKKGYTGETKFTDKPVRMKNRDGTDWEPGNYYPYYLGEVDFREGLVVSINTIAVQLIRILGVDAVTERAREVFRMKGNNIDERIKGEPSLSLGSVDLTPLELAKGYLVISSLGREIIPSPIRDVRGEDGRMILDYSGKIRDLSGRRIYSQKAMAEIREILKEVITRGTASSFIREPFSFDVAGKSGSSPSDSWFAGFNSEYLLVTWAGYDRPALSRKGKLPEFVVLPYWYNLMKKMVPGRKHFRN